MTDDHLKMANAAFIERGMVDPVIVHVVDVLGGWVVCAEGKNFYGQGYRDWVEVV